MRTLEKLELECEVYSVDLAYTFHLNKEKECGYQIKEAKKFLSNSNKHTLILGKNIAEVIDNQIGNKIDMLILDTTHYLPGELLDFLICYPYLSKQAVVVLDDLTFAHWGENTNAIATKILFDLVAADKVFPKNNGEYPKMAGFVLNEDTKKYVLDYFSGLLTPWWYELSKNEIEVYRNVVEKQYGEDEVLLFNQAVKINLETLDKESKIKQELRRVIEIYKSGKPTLIYGIGQRGMALNIFLKKQARGGYIGHIISDDRSKEVFEKIVEDIYHLCEILEYKDKYQILVAVADDEVRKNLVDNGVEYIDIPNYIFPFIKEYVELLC